MSKGLTTPLTAFEMCKNDTYKSYEEEQECWNIIETALKDLEWIKSILNINFFDSLEAEDKIRLLNIMGVKISYE